MTGYAAKVYEKPAEQKPLGTLTCRWGDNIGMDLTGIEWIAWNGFMWFRTGTSEHGDEFSGFIKCD
jgi:hypothetical protein